MEKKVLIVKNNSAEGPGILEEILISRKIPYYMIDLDQGDGFPENLSGLLAAVILGGPDSANDSNDKMKSELSFIQKIVSANIPYLGICLGLQTLVKAAGGSVKVSPSKEIGFRDPDHLYYQVHLTPEGEKDPLFTGLGKAQKVFHLHGETVELNGNMILLAEGKHCRNQVVRIGRHAYGIQCHFELTSELLDNWLNTDPDLMKLDREQVKSDFYSLQKEYRQTGKRLINNFLDIAGY